MKSCKHIQYIISEKSKENQYIRVQLKKIHF